MVEMCQLYGMELTVKTSAGRKNNQLRQRHKQIWSDNQNAVERFYYLYTAPLCCFVSMGATVLSITNELSS